MLGFWYKFGASASKFRRDSKLLELRHVYKENSLAGRQIEEIFFKASKSDYYYGAGRYEQAKESYDSDIERIDLAIKSLRDGFSPVRIGNRSRDRR